MSLKIRTFWLNHSLSVVTILLFVIFVSGQSLAGMKVYNEGQTEHSSPTVSYVEYLGTPHFFEALFENWESEFLQMGMYVLLTVYLFQKGSAESKEPGTNLPPIKVSSNSPWPVRRRGLWIKVYENSLSLALLSLFLASFLLHATSGARVACEEAMQHSSECVSTWGYLTTSQFWFESLQNWQSEFLAVFTLVVLSIYLRQRGSPESKLVEEPHSKTG